MLISNSSMIPAAFGSPRQAVSSVRLKIREPNAETESYKTGSGRDAAAVLGRDWVAIDPDTGALGSPRNKEEFAKTYEEIPEQPGVYRKKGLSLLVQVPSDWKEEVVLETRNNETKNQTVPPGDYIAIDSEGFVYHNTAAHVAKNLTFI